MTQKDRAGTSGSGAPPDSIDNAQVAHEADGDRAGRPMGRRYAAVLAFEALVIAALWLLGRLFA